MVQEKKNKQLFRYKNQLVNIILNGKKKQNKKTPQNKHIIKKTKTYGYNCMFMFGIKQPKSKSPKIDICTFQFLGFYVARQIAPNSGSPEAH